MITQIFQKADVAGGVYFSDAAEYFLPGNDSEKTETDYGFGKEICSGEIRI